MKCTVLTLGCKVNTYESEHIKEKFKESNYEIVDLYDNPDVVVINTCTVTNQSDSKSRKMIRLAKKINPNAIIVVCGCASEHHKVNIVDVDIDILIGNYYKSKIVELVDEYKNTKNKINTFVDMNDVPFEDLPANQETISFMGDIDCEQIYMDLYGGWIEKEDLTHNCNLLKLK